MLVITRHRLFLRILLALWFAAVVGGSLVSGAGISSMEKVLPFLGCSDKLLHFGGYFGLAALSLLSFERWRGYALAFSMILVGAMVEFGQHYAPGRTPDVIDEAANTLGVLSGVAAGWLLTRTLGRNRNLPNEPESRASASAA